MNEPHGSTAEDAAIDLSIRQFIDAWRVMFAHLPGASVAAADGVEYVFSGLPIGFFNIAFVTARGDAAGALASRGRAACARAAASGLPWLLLATHEALAPGVDPVSALAPVGLVPMLPLTGMMAPRVSPGRPAPADLQLLVPDDDAHCAAMLDVNGVAYGMSLEAGRPSLGRQAFWKNHAPALGLSGGAPVACAAVLESAGHHYVALVATVPSHQRRGYAEAAMRHALATAEERYGPKPSFLHATAAGRPLYTRMGYRTVSTHTVFIEQRFLEGH